MRSVVGPVVIGTVVAGLIASGVGPAASAVPLSERGVTPIDRIDPGPRSSRINTRARTSISIKGPRSVRAGRSVRISGKVSRGNSKAVVLVQRSMGGAGGWLQVARTRVNRAGKYGVKSSALAGPVSYRAEVIAGSRKLATSKTITVRGTGQPIRSTLRRGVLTINGTAVSAVSKNASGDRVVALKPGQAAA